MRKCILLSLVLLASLTTFSQDFSNKGKDFYLCFPQHVPSGANARLSIWITSDKASSGTITMANSAFSSTFNILANGLAEIDVPYAAAHISNPESTTEFFTQILKKSIRVKVDAGKPAVVAYVQEYGNARSAATLLLPVNVLGKKYFAISANQSGADAGGNLARSQFHVIAVKDNTVIQITPMKNGVKGAAFTVTLPLAGDMIQYQSPDGAAATQDLTGTLIESIASGSGGCLPIAVFSGSSNLRMATQSCATTNSYDPLFQQLYPVSTWGKNFGFVPFANYPAGVPYRVMAAEDNTNVYFNGALVATINAGQIYPATFTLNPPTLTAATSITADKPICVAEYAQSSSCAGLGAGNIQGDPDMVILNPIEQNIADITIFSTKQQFIRTQWINVLMKTIATPSFRISRNGCPLAPPTSAWQPFAPLPGYSYLREPLPLPGTGTCSAGGVSDSYRLLADSGFNAIAYGLGDNETYAYSAGTYIKDLNSPGVFSIDGIENNKVCVGKNFKIKIPLPYLADSIYWDLSGLPGGYPNVWTYYPPSTPDSVTGPPTKPIYWYSLPTNFSVAVVGIFPIKVTTYSQNTDGCGSEQDVEFEIEITGPPTTDFTSVAPRCPAETAQFNDASIASNPFYKWWWDFGDPTSGLLNNATIANPTHLFTGPGTYNVRYVNITTPGCVSDTIVHQVIVPDMPSGTISGNTTVCINSAQQNITFTGTGGNGLYTFTYTIDAGAGPGAPQTVSSVGPVITIPFFPITAGTFIYTLTNVTTTGSTLCTQNITGQAVTIVVQPDATITLTSAPGTTNQTVCVNNAIANITYQVGGSGTGANVVFTPALPGVTGTYAGGIVTIQGTPTAAGVYSYTVTTTGPCVNVPLSGTITVNDNSTLTLTSAPGTANQTVCINNSIAQITYQVAGGGTGANIVFTPFLPGMTSTYFGGVFTIQGSPSVAGTFNYTVTTTGPCINPALSGTITVNADATITLTSAPATTNQTVCVNNAITNITYQVGGSGTGGNVVFTPVLPGVTGTYAGGIITIQGTPTAAGLYSYTVTPTGPCINPPMGGTITVNDNSTLTLTSAAATTNQTVCINNNITNITYQVAGGGNGANVVFTPALPGVTGTYFGGVFTIQGAPSISGTFNYTVTTTGPCINPSLSGTITVNPNATITLTSAPATTNQTVCVNNAIANITYQVGGSGTGANVVFTPVLPGVTGTYAGGIVTIQGTPTLAGVYSYTVTPTGPCINPPLGGTITVSDNSTLTLTSAAATTNQTVCINNNIVNITYQVSGGGTGAAVVFTPALPGVTGTFAGGIFTIQGAPSISGTFNYTVTTTGPCINPSLSGTITVNANATLTLTSAPATTNQTVCVNNAIANITYQVGGSGTGANVVFTPALPGVTGTFAGGIVTIQGTPTASGVYTYTVTPTGPCVNPPLGGTITVNANSTITLTSAAATTNQTVCVNNSIANITYQVAGGGTGAAVVFTPALPGVTGTFAGGVFTIQGSPTITGTFSYTVTTTGPCINPSLSGTITVNANATLTLTSAPATTNQTVCVNNAIANITYQVGGSGTGANVVFTPVIPGVTGTFAGGIVTIQGTPTAAGVYNYTVTPTGPCVNPPLGGTITVNANSTITLTSAPATTNQTICINTAIAQITYQVAGGGSGATVVFTPALPGVTGTFAGGIFTIQGAPSISGVFNYTVTTTGPCINPSLSGTITVNANATLTLTSAAATTNQTVCINNAIANITYQVGGSGTGANVVFTPVLPGVTGTYAGGIVTIQGTPTAAGVYAYTVTPTGPCVNPPLGGTITVNNNSTITLTSAAGTTNQAVCINSAIANITYQVAGGGIGANVVFTPALPGVTGTFAGGIMTIQGTPTTNGVFNYTVTTTGPCINPSLSGTITVNPAPSATIAGTTEVCQGDPTAPLITFTGSGGTRPYIFTYTINGGAPQTVSTTALSNSATVSQSTAVANTFIYKLISVQDGSITACSQNMNVPDQSIKVNPLPTATISGAKRVCINSAPVPITFTGAGGTLPYTFRYRVNVGGPLQTISTTGTSSSVILQAPTTAAGLFDYILESVQDGSATGCQQIQNGNALVDVSNIFPNPSFTYTPSVCLPNAVVQFQNTSNIADGSAMTFSWAFGDGSLNASTFHASHQYGSVGPFNVILTATSNAGCVTATPPVLLNNIHPQPKADFSFSNPAGVCIKDPVTLTDLSDGKDGVITQWFWDLGDGTKPNSNPVTHTYLDTITYNVTLYTVNNIGCNSDTITKPFTVHPYPHVNAGIDRFILEGGQITLSPVVYGNDLTFLWTPNQYLIDNRIEKVKVNKPLTDMLYTLTVTARGGCALSDDVFVKLLKFPVIPNTFTPNNDGIHDKWAIDYLNTYPDNRVQVFTRTGQLVFESRGYNTPWDGTIKGKPLPFDTYYYIIEPGNGRDPITGYVTILK